MKRTLFTLAFWLDAGERAIKTAAQSAVLAAGADTVLDVMQTDWGVAGKFALSGLVLSLLTSIASIPASGQSPASIAPPGV